MVSTATGADVRAGAGGRASGRAAAPGAAGAGAARAGHGGGAARDRDGGGSGRDGRGRGARRSRARERALGDEPGGQRRDPAHDQAGARPGRLGQPARDRAADRGRPEEDDGVQRHDAAAQLGRDGELGAEFTPAANVTLAAPSGTRAASSSGKLGATAASSMMAPNEQAATVRMRGLTRPRAPEASAPATEPTPIAAVSAAYAEALPCHVNFASRGSSTWKLNDSVPTTAIMPSGTRSAGVAST